MRTISTPRVHCLMIRVFIGILILAPLPAKAGTPNTGEDLIKNCSSKASESSDHICQWYLKGFIDGHGKALGGQGVFCLPTGGFSMDQLRRVVLKWLEHHPEKLHLGSGEVVQVALKEAFRCTGQSGKKP